MKCIILLPDTLPGYTTDVVGLSQFFFMLSQYATLVIFHIVKNAG